MRFLLSIHDVWPGNFPLVEHHWQRLRSLGAGHIALMVVPRYHGKRPLAGEVEFLAWLKEKEAAGSEIFLHGYHHLMQERLDGAQLQARRSRWGNWVNRRLVGGEAEFCGLGDPDKVRLLDLGLEAFRQDGIAAGAFVAPTWHGAPPESALRDRGFTLWETRFGLRHLPSGASRLVPPVSWGPVSDEPALMGGTAWLAALVRLPLIKVALHPGDLKGVTVFKTLEGIASRGREIAYGDVFASAKAGLPVAAPAR